jgi:hypothetical protein
MPSYTREDFEEVACDECGRTEGTFYFAESDNERTEHLCLDCLMNTPTQAEVDFKEALESSSNWELGSPGRDSRIRLVCVHCGEEADESWREDDRELATEFLQEDKEHLCYPCVICEDATDGERTIDGDCYCEECYAKALKEDGVDDEEERGSEAP